MASLFMFCIWLQRFGTVHHVEGIMAMFYNKNGTPLDGSPRRNE
ncbi:MAG TPA: hypothetical protein VF095_05490 [Bacillota bacterium]